MAKLAVSLHKPSTDLLLLAGLEDVMRKRAGRAGGAGTDFEEFARNMGKIFGFKVVNRSFYNQVGCIIEYAPFADPLDLDDFSLSFSISIEGSWGASSFLVSESGIDIF